MYLSNQADSKSVPYNRNTHLVSDRIMQQLVIHSAKLHIMLSVVMEQLASFGICTGACAMPGRKQGKR